MEGRAGGVGMNEDKEREGGSLGGVVRVCVGEERGGTGLGGGIGNGL